MERHDLCLTKNCQRYEFYGIVMNYIRFATRLVKTDLFVAADWASPTWSPWWWHVDDDNFVLDHLVMNDAADVAPRQS
jgi:hypothetical protein